MSSEPLSFFTVDRGTASTAVSLIAPVEGRFRLLAAGSAPAGADLDVLLEDLVRRVGAIDADLLPAPEGWPDWARLTTVTAAPPRVVCAATTDRSLALLERTFSTAGWEVAARIVAGRADALAANEAVLDPTIPALALTAGDPPSAEERAPLPPRGALLAARVSRRADIGVGLCGTVGGWGDGFPAERTTRLPQPFDGPPAADSELRAALRELAGPRPDDAHGRVPVLGRPGSLRHLPDGRTGLRVAVATLAGLLDRRVEAVEVGHAAGSRVLASPDGVVAHLVSADGALVPARALRDEREVEAIARWSTLRTDPFTLHDRIRNLAVRPWRDAAGDGSRLRLAALRAALARLDAAWRATAGPDALAGDHARVLAPLGTLPDEADRRRLLVDLLDDILLPLGSAVVASDVRPGARTTATLRITSSLQQHDLELSPGVLRLVDLPPGVPARVELETREGSLLGTKSRRMALDVTGGLGGLLVDTREIPLRLPDRAERRRALLEAWERPVWAAVEP